MNSPVDKNNNKQKAKHGKTWMVGFQPRQQQSSSPEPRSHRVNRGSIWGRRSQTDRRSRSDLGIRAVFSQRRSPANWVGWFITACLICACSGGCSRGAESSQLTNEQQILALTLLAEARGEGVQGMEAVAMVIKQRMTNRSQTATQVCLAPKQFSAWNGRSKTELEYLWRSPAAPEAINVVRRFDELDPAVIDYADHYCTVRITPYWALDQQPVAVIGNHKFFRLKY